MKAILVGKSLLITVSALIISCSSAVKTDKNLNGKSIEFIKENIGIPTYEKEFVLTKALYEYQYELLSYYPEPNGKNIQIKELGWNKGHKMTIVWFHKINHKWVSLCNVIWNPNRTKF